MARNFDGTGDSITSTAAGARPSAYPFTMGFWAKQPILSNWAYGISLTTGTLGEFHTIGTTNDGYWNIVSDDNSNWSHTPGTTTIVLDTWYHVVAVWVSNTSRLIYVDGVLEGTSSDGYNIDVDLATTLDQLTVGDSGVGNVKGNDFNIAEAFVFDVELSAAEIFAIAKGARPYQIRPGSLLTYWPLYGYSSPEPDLSGNVNDGTVSDASLRNHAPVGPYILKRNRSNFITPKVYAGWTPIKPLQPFLHSIRR